MKYRIGFGYDTHRLTEGRDLWLGGFHFKDASKGLHGHSDADVLIHAICDALLGAASLGDIGTHFPDTDSKWKNADSKKLLVLVVELIKERGYKVGNVDTTVCLEKPKLQPIIPEIKRILASLLNVTEESISIKATTNEQLGFVGREEGIAAYAVVLVYHAEK